MKHLLIVAILFFANELVAQTIEVYPYVQPGNGFDLKTSDTKNIIWLTGPESAEFSVEYNVKGETVRSAKIDRTALDFPKSEVPARKDPPILERAQNYLRYTAALTDLPFDTEVEYRVKLDGKLVRGGSFQTRSSYEKPVRFIAVGDLAKGNPIQNAVAYQMYKSKPQFLIALGDIVYPTGRALQYFNHYWKTYNQSVEASPTEGVPMMASVPFYPVVGNHDLDSKLGIYSDSLALYHFFSVPLSGPGEGPWNPPLPKEHAQKFREMAGVNFPAASYYSFDAGAAHFLVLDSNSFDLARLSAWIEKDLTSSQAHWKIVCVHAPAFHSSRAHYDAQKMRTVVPLLQRCGVDLFLAGHVHNYQRSKPFRFELEGERKPGASMVDGKFQIDAEFDGVEKTRPNGIIHIVSGGGGASLYKDDMAKNTDYFLKNHSTNWAPYTEKHVSDRHSFVTIELTPERLELKALDGLTSEVFDKITITKPKP